MGPLLFWEFHAVTDPKYISDPKSSRNASQDRCCWWQKQTRLLAMCAGSRPWKWPNTAGRGQLQLLFVVHLSNRVPFMCSLLLKHLRVTLRRGTNRIKKRSIRCGARSKNKTVMPSSYQHTAQRWHAHRQRVLIVFLVQCNHLMSGVACITSGCRHRGCSTGIVASFRGRIVLD